MTSPAGCGRAQVSQACDPVDDDLKGWSAGGDGFQPSHRSGLGGLFKERLHQLGMALGIGRPFPAETNQPMDPKWSSIAGAGSRSRCSASVGRVVSVALAHLRRTRTDLDRRVSRGFAATAV